MLDYRVVLTVLKWNSSSPSFVPLASTNAHQMTAALKPSCDTHIRDGHNCPGMVIIDNEVYKEIDIVHFRDGHY